MLPESPDGGKYPKPMGPEEIVYGDKVINLANTDPKMPWNRHRKVYPEKDNPYIANGEIGMAVGFFWKKVCQICVGNSRLNSPHSRTSNTTLRLRISEKKQIRCWSWLMRSPSISLKAASLAPSFWFCQIRVACFPGSCSTRP